MARDVSAALRRVFLLRWCALLVALPFLAACGKTTSSTPSPQAIATAESVSRDVEIDAPVSATPQAGTAEDEPAVVLHGRLFGSGSVGVILAHMRPADQTAWFPYATELAKSGQFTILTFDFRGFGESPGDKDFDEVDTDLMAAYSYMRRQLGISKIFLVGASMGGTASIVVAARNDVQVAGVVSISSPEQFETMDALAAVSSVAVPKLFLASAKNVPAKNSQDDLVAAAPEPKQRSHLRRQRPRHRHLQHPRRRRPRPTHHHVPDHKLSSTPPDPTTNIHVITPSRNRESWRGQIRVRVREEGWIGIWGGG